MSQSPTEGAVEQPASQEPTGEELQNTAADLNQETISGEPNTQETVTDEPAEPKQTEKEGGEVQTDDSLAKFAKGQGIEDVSTLTERELKLLKVAKDNVSSYRNSGQELQKTANEVFTGANSDERLAHLEWKTNKNDFFSRPDVDPSLENTMAEVLAEQRKQYGDDRGKLLLADLPTLYQLAQAKQLSAAAQAAKEEGRREERDSIQRQASASAPNAHATQAGSGGKSEVTLDWIRNEYDPGNAEHRQMLDDYYAGR